MPLTAGTRIGPYEITGVLGAGGMGDVYKARDTRLDRTVAIKIVRSDFSERFEREARSISALNHPNICTLHDVGRLRAEDASAEASADQGDVSYLVLEFVDGAPIAGPLPIADVLRLGMQICDALDAAHRLGIVHRDLKPANILGTKAGIKLLDFGLAKLQAKTPAGAPGNEATVAALTGAHTIVGTPQYMAPEQIEGREADARSDIFALGCVLYELITGKRAFDGKTTSNVMAAVLATEPRRISELVPVTPPALEWVVWRCLEKDPDARWQSARDVALQLKWMADQPAHAGAGVGSTASSRRSLLTGVAIGVVVAGVAALAWIWPRAGTAPTPAGEPVSLAVQLPAKLSLALGGARPAIALSPDGRTIAFAAGTGDDLAIYLRPLDRFDAVKIAGTEGGAGAFFSPDSQWIGFAANGQLKKIPIGGGVAVPICDAPVMRGAVWLADDTIAFTPLATGGLMRVPAAGGTPTPLTTLDPAKHEKTHRSMVALPGGKAVVFVIGSNEIETYDDARIVALTLDTGRVTELVKGYAPLFSPTGHLLYVHDATVFAVPFNPVGLKMTGSPVQVLKDVAVLPNYGTAEFGLSPNGVLVFAAGGNQTEQVAVRWVDRKGVTQPIPAPTRQYFLVEISPDGRRLALGVAGANNVLWAYDLDRNQMTRLTLRFDVEAAVWTHDGSRLTYWTGSDVRSIAADGSGTEEVLIPASEIGDRVILPQSWSADGQSLVVTVYTSGKGDDVMMYARRDKRLVPIAATRFQESNGRLSPDGAWLVYLSDESGRTEAYVRAADGSGAKYAVSNDGGFFARWTQQGRELIYGGPNGLMTVSFAAGQPPRLGTPALLIQGKAFDGAFELSPTADGQRFAALFRTPAPPLTEIRVVLNWAQGLVGKGK